MTEEVAAEALVAPPENVTLNAVFGDGNSDEDDDDDDDDGKRPAPPAKPPANPPRRVSSRVKGVAAPEPDDAMAGTKKGKRAPNGGESAQTGAVRAARAHVLAVEPSGASSSGCEDEHGDTQDDDVRAGIALLARGAAAVDEKDQSNQHASRVWVDKSPTGFQLTSERFAKMDHKDGKPWGIVV